MTHKTSLDTVHFIITGGTIDDLDYDKGENAPKNHKSLIPNLLKQSRITFPYTTSILMQKDSRVITDKDRQLLLKACKDTSSKRIIVTHGTFTMSETAKYLGRLNLAKTIIFFGAAIPANRKSSDALFNMGGRLLQLKSYLMEFI